MMLSEKEIKNIVVIAKIAGDIILEFYKNHKEFSVTAKEDNSPVTQADLSANEFIIKELEALFPNIAIISEENSREENSKAAAEERYFIIDPLDGTESFIKKYHHFTVNIALIENCNPIFGVIYSPVLKTAHYTFGNKSFKIEDFSGEISGFNNAKNIKVSDRKDGLIVICTKRETERSAVINHLKNRKVLVKEIYSIASSYKFCLIAEGKADLYLRYASINAWDVAAGQAIVNCAGGNMVDLE